MNLDRIRQREILEHLSAVYPRQSVDFVRSDFEEEDIVNVWYLREHGLVTAALELSLGGSFLFEGACITARGMDFLADDGGLSAILGTVVVKVHAESMRELLLSKVSESDLPPEDKARLSKRLETVSTETLKTVTKTLVDRGLQKIPDLLSLVQGIIERSA
jgi:hypothetical protein